jgi:RNA polymerase primary sigma factor
MFFHDLTKDEMAWQSLLNSPEARVLSACEERELLVELDDYKNKILASTPVRDREGEAASNETSFQRLIRELASAPGRPDQASNDPQSLASRYQETRSKLALANVRLVAHVAKRYAGRGVSPADLIQEGICALLAAIDRFDVSNQTRLATYAIWWIRQGIQRAVAASAYPVRLNPRQLLRLAQLSHEEGYQPRPSNGADKQLRVDLSPYASSETLMHLQVATRPSLSLDAPSRNDGVTAVVDYLSLSGQEESETEDRGEAAGVLIEQLSPREQLVLTLRFGLKGSEQQTLVQVSKLLGVSKERVRQIEARALKRLREGAARIP